MDSYSVSCSAESGATVDHAQRTYTPPSAARELEPRNVYIKLTDDHKAEFNDFYRPVIESYNASQKRADRKKSLDYYAECVETSKKDNKNPVEQSLVIQIGDRETAGILTPAALAAGIDKQYKAAVANGEPPPDLTPYLSQDPDRQKLKEILIRVGQQLPKRFPHFHFTTIVIHDDEPSGTCHLDAQGFFHATGYYQRGKPAGLQTRWSQGRALEQMGCVDEDGYPDISVFYKQIKAFTAEEMAKDGYRRKYKSNTKEHKHTDAYVAEKEREAAEEARRAAEAAQKASEGLLEQAREDAARMRQAAQKASEGLLEQAREDAARMRQEAQRASEAAQRAAQQAKDEAQADRAAQKAELERLRAIPTPVTSAERQMLDVAKRTSLKGGTTMYSYLQQQVRVAGIKDISPQPTQQRGRYVGDMPDLS